MRATQTVVYRLHPCVNFPYNQTMKYQKFLTFSRVLPRVLIIVLCLAMLTACSGVSGSQESGALLDEDNASLSATPETVETIPPDRVLDVTAKPMESLSVPDSFAILFVNVGKADAAILRFGDTTVLIDTGSAESAPQLIGGLNALGVTSINAVFVTHSHSDHLGGLDALSANYDISMVYSPFFSEADKNDIGKIVKRAEKLSLPHAELKAGDTVPVADGVTFRVLGPLALNETDDNENSLVLQFTYGGKTFLFTGDMQFAEEQALIASGVSLKSDVLKVGNHGNPDATGDDFGALVSPGFAVISTNTVEDPDSANPRVYAALPSAQIAVTQDFPIGVLLTLDDSGAIVLGNPAREVTASTVKISNFDVAAQTVTLENIGASPADLSGMILYSVRSGAVLRFSDGTTLAVGGSLIVGSGGDFSFPGEDKPLSKKKDNTVILYDRFGSLVAKLEQ